MVVVAALLDCRDINKEFDNGNSKCRAEANETASGAGSVLSGEGSAEASDTILRVFACGNWKIAHC